MAMKTSAKGLEFIGKWEGEVLHVYKDIAGIPTIGVGHVVRPGESFPNGITHDQAMTMLAHDASTAEAAVNEFITASLTQNQFDALVSFTFNCGGGSLEHSSMRAKLNAGDVQGAADALLQWCHTVINGKVTQDVGLLRRRQSERQLFLTPEPKPVVPAPAPPVEPPPPPPPAPIVPAPVQPPSEPSPQPLVPPSVPQQKSLLQTVIDVLTWLFNALFKPRK